jgi:hypothetical protein
MHLLNESQPTGKNPIVNIVVELEGGERKPAVRAEIINSGQVSAEGITVRSTSPLLALCRKLAAAGYDPTTPLEAYRCAVPPRALDRWGRQADS